MQAENVAICLRDDDYRFVKIKKCQNRMTQTKVEMAQPHIILKLNQPTVDDYEGSDRPDRPRLVKGTPEYATAKAKLDSDLEEYQAQRCILEATIAARAAFQQSRIHRIFGKQTSKQDVSYADLFALEPEFGVYHDVAELDFASLYPSCMTQEDIKKARDDLARDDAAKKVSKPKAGGYSEMSAFDFKKLYPSIMKQMEAELTEVCDKLSAQGTPTRYVVLPPTIGAFEAAIRASDTNKRHELSDVLGILKDGLAARRYSSMVAHDFNDIYPYPVWMMKDEKKKLSADSSDEEIVEKKLTRALEDDSPVGPNVVDKPPPLITEAEAQEQRRLDQDALSYYEMHSRHNSTMSEWSRVSDKARSRWPSLTLEAKLPYLELAKEHRDRKERLKDFFDRVKFE